MNIIAALARYGNVQPDVTLEMDYLVARELARRVIDLHKNEIEANAQLHVELTKALMKAQGAKVM